MTSHSSTAAGPGARPPAALVLEDGRIHRGTGFGATGTTLGEAVFTTAMSGYQETLTDPSYFRQIVVATAPQIGNTGWNDEDGESLLDGEDGGGRIWVAGYVVRELSRRASNHRAQRTLEEEMLAQGAVGIAGVDTRAVVRHIREKGAMKAGIFSGADLANLVNESALLAARKGKDKAYMADLEEAKDKVMLGAERKSMVLSEAERRLTAYHEAGHAVVGLKIPGLDPVHKVTIVPRGRALGVTASLPQEDRHSYSRDYLQAQLAYLFGGRAAEEMIFGPEKITTGAGNDIERATSLSRRMVTTFGMSDAIGPMAIGDSEQEVFLGREITQRREVSQKTAELVDAEVKRLLDDAYDRAMRTLEENRDLLESLAQALLERETLDREEIDLLVAGEPLPPRSDRDDGAPAEVEPADERSAGLVPALDAATDHEVRGEAEQVESREFASRAAREDAGSRVQATEAEPDPSH
mgnify:CR=1 FL=1